LKPLYIAFEGIEGCGKTTQVLLLCNWLKQKSIPFVRTVEPGGTEVGKLLRDIILHKEVEPVTELFLYLADRREHLDKVVKPALSSNLWVVSDRCFLSTVCYQGYGRGIPVALVKELNDFVINSCKPDIIFVLDVSVEEAFRRIKPSDRLERESFEFHERVRQGYLKEAEKLSNVCVLSATAPPHEVFEAVRERLENLIGERD